MKGHKAKCLPGAGSMTEAGRAPSWGTSGFPGDMDKAHLRHTASLNKGIKKSAGADGFVSWCKW